jgi:methyltransferase (TIGR00027 family)
MSAVLWGCHLFVAESSNTLLSPSYHHTQLTSRVLCGGDARDRKLHAALMPFRDAALRWLPGVASLLRRSAEKMSPGSLSFIAARTAAFDAAARDALASGARQFVAVAAGFDARALRLAASPAAAGVSFYEVDRPKTVERKRKLVARLFPRDRPPAFVGADLSRARLEAALAAAPGYDASLPTFFTAEGLVYYLPPPALGALLDGFAAAGGPGSRVALDFLPRELLDGRAPMPPGLKARLSRCSRRRPGATALLAASSPVSPPPILVRATQAMQREVAARGEPLLSGLPGDEAALAAELAAHGLRLRTLLGPRELAARIGRTWNDARPPLPTFLRFAIAEKA